MMLVLMLVSLVLDNGSSISKKGIHTQHPKGEPKLKVLDSFWLLQSQPLIFCSYRIKINLDPRKKNMLCTGTLDRKRTPIRSDQSLVPTVTTGAKRCSKATRCFYSQYNKYMSSISRAHPPPLHSVPASFLLRSSTTSISSNSISTPVYSSFFFSPSVLFPSLPGS